MTSSPWWYPYRKIIKIVVIDTGVTTIDIEAFAACYNLISVTIPNTIIIIGDGAFRACENLASVTIPNSVNTIEDYTFYGCESLTSITIPNLVTDIGRYAFAWCKSLTSVIIPDSVTTIGNVAFWDCTHLISLTVGNSVTIIGDRAFQNCYFLQNITLPKSVTTIGSSAFDYCVNLSFIRCEATTPPVIDSNTFRNVPKTIPVYVPCNSYNAYKTADYWKNFTNFITIPDTLNTIFIFDTICYGKVYNGNGFNISDGAGTYYDTLQTIHGCDSVIICLTLSEYSIVPISYDTAVICQGDSYSFGKKDLTEEGIYYDTLQSINFCDSIICLNLSYYPTIPVSYDTVTIYQGNSYIFGGKELTIAGIYYDTLQNTNGCDSIVCLNLIVTNNITEIKTFNLTVYPNPTNSQLTINNEQLIINNVELFDIFGKCWLSLQSLLSPEPIIDISHLPNGIYILKINNLIINKIIKL